MLARRKSETQDSWDVIEVRVDGSIVTQVPAGQQMSFAVYQLPDTDEPLEFVDSWVPGSVLLELDKTEACTVGHEVEFERSDATTEGSIVLTWEVSMYVRVPHHSVPREDEADVTIEEL